MSGSGTSRTSRDVRLESAKWATADIDDPRSFTNRDFMSTRPSTDRPVAVGDKAVLDGPENAAPAGNLRQLAASLVMRDRPTSFMVHIGLF